MITFLPCCFYLGFDESLVIVSPDLGPMGWKSPWKKNTHGYSTKPPPGHVPPPRNKGLIAGLIKGNQWVFISPDHKAGYFWGDIRGIRGGLVDQPQCFHSHRRVANPSSREGNKTNWHPGCGFTRHHQDDYMFRIGNPYWDVLLGTW